MTPWFPYFDANTMVVSKMPVWVRLHNLPLHFWHHNVLIAIGNTLGKFLKIDGDRLTRGLFTFAIPSNQSSWIHHLLVVNFPYLKAWYDRLVLLAGMAGWDGWHRWDGWLLGIRRANIV